LRNSNVTHLVKASSIARAFDRIRGRCRMPRFLPFRCPWCRAEVEDSSDAGTTP
jgi:hypothetical protein